MCSQCWSAGALSRSGIPHQDCAQVDVETLGLSGAKSHVPDVIDRVFHLGNYDCSNVSNTHTHTQTHTYGHTCEHTHMGPHRTCGDFSRLGLDECGQSITEGCPAPLTHSPTSNNLLSSSSNYEGAQENRNRFVDIDG